MLTPTLVETRAVPINVTRDNVCDLVHELLPQGQHSRSMRISQQHRPIYPGCYPTAQAAAPDTDGAFQRGLGGIHRAVSRLLKPEKPRLRRDNRRGPSCR